MTTLFTTAFLPPVDYFLAIAKSDNVLIEAHENYQKQSYRNRCEIVTSQGVQVLTIPVLHAHTGQSVPIADVEIEYRTPWQTKLLRALRTAYATAPFFIHYFDELSDLLRSRPTTLLAYNTALLNFLLRVFKLERPIAFTQTYEAVPCTEIVDLRTAFHPKTPRPEQLHYYQVFADRLPFYPNVSVIDLLFNEGGNYLVQRAI